jgi:hypothetical protein
MRCITPVCHGSITWTDILQMTNYLAIWLVRLGRSSKSECGCAKLTLRDPLSSAARNPNLSSSGLNNAARRVSSEINLDIRCRCRLLARLGPAVMSAISSLGDGKRSLRKPDSTSSIYEYAR